MSNIYLENNLVRLITNIAKLQWTFARRQTFRADISFELYRGIYH